MVAVKLALSCCTRKSRPALRHVVYPATFCVRFLTAHARHLCRILDNLPVAMVRMREGQGEAVKTYERGFPVGRIDVRP